MMDKFEIYSEVSKSFASYFLSKRRISVPEEEIRIKRFRLKTGADLVGVKDNPCLSHIHKDAVREVKKYLPEEDISIEIGFPRNLSEWNDSDFVVVLDLVSWCPYQPFYNYIAGKCDVSSDKSLPRLIHEYNTFLSSLPYLEEIK